MAERGEAYHPSNLSRHRSHVVAPEQTAELERLTRELEQEASMAPPTVGILYRQLIRGVQAMQHQKPPTVAEMSKLVTSISTVTGLNTRRLMMLEYANRIFQPGGVYGPTTEAQQFPAPVFDEE